MRDKSSKRQRKHKATQSLKGKQQAQQANALDILGEEVEIDDGDLGSNALILPARADGGSGGRGAEGQQQQPQLSKSQLKKLRQVQMKKERREQLSQVLSELHSSSLPDEQLGLLRPLHQRGAKETKKQRLRRALKLQRAGLADVEGADELLRPRRVRGTAAAGSSSSSEDGSSSSSEEEQEQAQAQAQAQGGAESDDDDDDSRPAKQARTTGASDTAAAAAAATAAQQRGAEDAPEDAAAAAARQKAELGRLRRAAAAMKAEARREATGAEVGEEEAEEAAATAASAAEAAAAAAAGPTRVVVLERPPEMAAARQQLPMIGLEQEVMEGINRHDVVVLCGETGCGKTTQVPQFLLEAGFGCRDFPERSGAVCVTQPRRVAAISTAERVAAELGVRLGGLVGYQVRHDRRVGSESAVRFLTDGVLMRQLQSDFLLRQYSVVLLDEAHERSLNTDLLLGMLSRLVPLRRRLHEQWKAAGCPPATPSPADAGGSSGGLGPVYPLKLVIMSATLRTSDFTGNPRLFPAPPPVLSVPARQFPVTIHFSRQTELQDYLGTAVRKVCRIHRELPGGGILLFLTGQREVQVAVRRIRQTFAKAGKAGAAAAGGGRPRKKAAAASGSSGPGEAAAAAGDDDDDADDGAAAGADAAEMAADAADAALEADLADAAAGDAAAAAADDYDQLEADEDEDDVIVMGGDGWSPEELAAAEARFEETYGLSLNPAGSSASTPAAAGAGGGQQQQQQQRSVAPVHVLPLYAMLPQQQQAAVFQPVPAGHRLIVVATNVAETSITIPGIRYVVDAGRSKQKLLESPAAAAGSTSTTTSSGGAAVARYAVDWVSKAAAEQRAGRAGRTGPGHVYRLYSSAHFNDSFRQHSQPEIANTPLEGVVLQLKAMGVDRVANFPFPSPPEPAALQSATRCLLALSALAPEPAKQQQQQQQPSPAAAAAAGKLTPLGRAMSVFPITPRHSRMLLQLAVWQQRALPSSSGSRSALEVGAGPLGGVSAAAAVKALPYAVALAAALSLESPFMHIDALASELESAAAAKDEAAAAKAAAGDDDAESAQGRREAAAATAADKAAKAESRKKAQRASAAHARFRSSYGDALSSLNALCGYEAAAAAGQAEDFCEANFLHARHLREMSQLRQQLGRMLLQLHSSQAAQQAAAPAAAGGGGSEAVQLLQLLMGAVEQVGPDRLVQPLAAPSSGVLEVLRRALAAGWCDQVSRRVRSADHIARLNAEGRLARHATRYTPAGLSEEVFLHPRSCLASVAPEYVVYGDILQTAKRPYMALVTAIEPQWLADCGSALCKVSGPLTEPPPLYQPAVDAVLAHHDAAYSAHDWPLPRLLLPHPDAASRAAVFAAALLAGKVLPALGQLSGVLLAPAATAARQELQGLPRVGELVNALQTQQVFSRAALAAVWARQPQFLRQQLAAWLQRPKQHLLDALWPQLLQQAAAGGEAGAGAATGAGGPKKKGKKRHLDKA